MKKPLIIVLVCVISILFAAGYYIYSEFYGDPISKYFANNNINRYINSRYPGEQFTIKDTSFEFKTKLYIADVQSTKNQDIHFQIGIKKGGGKVYFDEYIEKYAKDNELSERFANCIRKRITNALSGKIPQISKVEVIIYIKKGKYPIGTEYSDNIEEPYSVIANYEGERIEKQEFVALCYNTKEILKEKGFTVNGYIFDYRERNGKDKGGFGYSLELGKEQLSCSKQEMLEMDSLSAYGNDND